MVACVRLLAVLLAVFCVTATVQTGAWSGPADLANVGEGRSMLPDRRFDESVLALLDAGSDHVAILPEHVASPAERVVILDGEACPDTSEHHPASRRPGAPRGPPFG